MPAPRDFDEWRAQARALLRAGVAPDDAGWSDATVPALFDSAAPGGPGDAGVAPRIPRPFLAMLRAVAQHRDPARWDLMYRLLWRVAREGPAVLDDAADEAVRRAGQLAREVRRDLHKMHAFVRFREVPVAEGASRFVAWYEPGQLTLREGARFFARRFGSMDWTIVTPDGAATWDQRELRFIDSPPRDELPRADAREDLWRTYYRSICNLARLKPRAMAREMPAHRWKNLPEASEIPGLLREAPRRVAAFDDPRSRPWHAPIRSDGPAPREVPASETPETCRRCPLWERATQAVPGEGPMDAALMIVGEQPGDQEDLQGRPFVGPAGQLLDEVMREAGVDRGSVYVTNAVKHFKWEPRGKRRLHKTPAQREVEACGHWLREELARGRPRAVLALGATALRALLGPSAPAVGAARGMLQELHDGTPVIATWHPSAILRAERGAAARLRDELMEDLRRAAAIAHDARDAPARL